MGWWQKAAQLPLSPPLTSWKIPAGQPAPDLGWPVVLAHWLNPSWLSSFCVKLGLRRCDTVPSICRLVPALRHGDKSSIEETALGFEPLSQSSEPRKSPCPYFWAPSIGHGEWHIGEGRGHCKWQLSQPRPCLPSLPLGLLASAPSGLLHTTCPDGAW